MRTSMEGLNSGVLVSLQVLLIAEAVLLHGTLLQKTKTCWCRGQLINVFSARPPPSSSRSFSACKGVACPGSSPSKEQARTSKRNVDKPLPI
uniref:Uncharacterized protein n=1 Tax=Sphaerodactylus townsendi TaxID=933632 RepID=A0ACB8EAM5_9SAUR